MKSKVFYKSSAWKYCSRYVLLYYSDGLYVKCSTSGKILKINEANCHCGHLIKVFDAGRTNFATAFDFENLAPQSIQDNRYSGGKPDIMRKWLEEKHGVNKIDSLYIKRHNICRLDKFTIDYWKVYYKSLFDNLVKEKGNPWKN